MFIMRPRRVPIFCVTTPTNSSGQSMTRRSMGSCVTPFALRVITSGLLTASSKPSRRIISTRIAICSSPRPETTNASGVSPGSTFRLTFVSSSRSSLSLRLREVT